MAGEKDPSGFGHDIALTTLVVGSALVVEAVTNSNASDGALERNERAATNPNAILGAPKTVEIAERDTHLIAVEPYPGALENPLTLAKLRQHMEGAPCIVLEHFSGETGNDPSVNPALTDDNDYQTRFWAMVAHEAGEMGIPVISIGGGNPDERLDTPSKVLEWGIPIAAGATLLRNVGRNVGRVFGGKGEKLPRRRVLGWLAALAIGAAARGKLDQLGDKVLPEPDQPRPDWTTLNEDDLRATVIAAQLPRIIEQISVDPKKHKAPIPVFIAGRKTAVEVDVDLRNPGTTDLKSKLYIGLLQRLRETPPKRWVMRHYDKKHPKNKTGWVEDKSFKLND